MRARYMFQLGWKFYDADDYHPVQNKEKMASGVPLNDQDRIPWLCALHRLIWEDSCGHGVILACSSLRKLYRDILVYGQDASVPKSDREEVKKEFQPDKVLFVHLQGTMKVISERMQKRSDHFMPSALLQSQFDTLEPPAETEHFMSVSIEKSVPEIVLEIEKNLLLQL
ncbi:probable gluconokinase isoform X2 [Protopterus annectens]|uniref:probable gluconokinase isoform X2 n=1 Tax=Protopterus annectens TaxID=7888 RepID=UPI001CF99780|nr:probable gluconokinase isoform X2 [Protopterus annectens]XP_043939627.1 probable gluconokinase isoform X2 [Protopterus annectens]